MAIGGKPAARALKSKGVKPGKDSGASKTTKAAYTKMSNAGKGGFKKS